jgi:hypothetical protein
MLTLGAVPADMCLHPVTHTRESGMSTTHFDELETPHADAVMRWRFEELLRAGYDAGSALIVAGHAEVDLHEAVRLVERGCPPALAVQIVV